jgi:ComF family protein
MKMTEDEKGFLRFLKKLIFPEKITCYICGKEIRDNGLLCPECKNKIPYIHKGCFKCGCALYSGNYCPRCKAAAFDFERNYAAAGYDGFIKNIVYRFKNGDKYLYEPMGEIIVQTLIKENVKCDIIVSVPLSQKVLKKRGYNQSALLAQKISETTDMPYKDAVIKTRETDFQKNLTARERRKNIENAFEVSDKQAIQGKTVLAVDDVITTGTTLSEIAATLKKAGAKEVLCCTFAAVEHKIATDSFIDG